MLVANSFDLWQKDAFFSAAEEVQQSADTMESAYRAWLRAKKEGLIPQHLDKLHRELQMALGTAKWQLEEFERAVTLSYRNNGDDITVTRHREFLSAIEDQISRVETAVKESLKVEGKKPFRWVNLDKEESDDLAHFLSGTPVTSSHCRNGRNKDYSLGSAESSRIPYQASEAVPTGVENISCFTELQDRNVPEREDEISYRAGKSDLEIVVDRDDREANDLEATAKEKGLKPLIWGSRGDIYRRAKEVQSHTRMKLVNWINNHLRGHQRSQRQHVSPVLPVRSIRFVLALMLTIFLFGMFLETSIDFVPGENIECYISGSHFLCCISPFRAPLNLIRSELLGNYGHRFVIFSSIVDAHARGPRFPISVTKVNLNSPT